MASDHREVRASIFTQLSATEELGVSFFVMLLEPDLYVYHKKDSIEFNMALCGQAIAAVSPACSEMETMPPPGKIVTHKTSNLHFPWWKALRTRMQKTSWHWFVVAMEGARVLFVAETENFPMLPSDRCHLLKSVSEVWEESQLADLESAKDAFLGSILDTSRYAAVENFQERRGVRLI